ncbi:MAG: HTTM domain-containing protein [Verrucomicrobiota bacterium]
MTAFRDFWFRPEEDSIYARLRVAFSLVSLLNLIALWPDRMAFFSAEGLFDQQMTDQQAGFPSFSIFRLIQSEPWLTLSFLLAASAMILLGLGIRPRWAALIVYLWHLSCLTTAPYAMAGWDLVLHTFGFLILISPLGRSWAWPHLLQPLPPKSVPRYGLLLMRAQVVVIYWQAILARGAAPYWFDGEFFSYYLLSHHSRFGGTWILEAGWLFWFTWLALLTEALVPILLWFQTTRWIAVCAGAALHLGIALFSVNLHIFSLTMIMTYTVFLRESDLLAARDWILRLLSRFQTS